MPVNGAILSHARAHALPLRGRAPPARVDRDGHPSGRRWRLSLQLRDRRIEAGPGRCLRRPYCGGRFDDLTVVKRAAAYKYQVRAHFGLAEHLRATYRTEPAVHDVAAVGNAAVVAQLARHGNRNAREAGIDSATAGSQILAQPAPAHSRHNRCCADSIAHRLAQAPTGYLHDEPLSSSAAGRTRHCTGVERQPYATPRLRRAAPLQDSSIRAAQSICTVKILLARPERAPQVVLCMHENGQWYSQPSFCRAVRLRLAGAACASPMRGRP